MSHFSILRLGILGAAIYLGVPPTAALAADMQCPLQITVHEQTDASQVNGWEVYNGSRHDVHHFYGVAFSQGPPGDLVYLNPRKTVSKGPGKVEIYDFGSEIAGDIYISCLYRETSQVITKRVEPKPVQCKVSYDPKRVDAVKSVSCD
jgi:hypothetical protein